MKHDKAPLDFEDYPDPRGYNDPNEAMDQDELDRMKIIDILEEEFFGID